MNEEQIQRAAQLVKELCELTDTHLDDFLMVVAGQFFSEEECGQIEQILEK